MIVRDNSIPTESKYNQILNTSRLSLSAKGLLLYLLSVKPDNYELSIYDLCLSHCCSQSTMENILDELQNFGYLDYTLVKSDNGLIDGRFTIYDTPHTISMIRYDYKKEFIKKISKAEKTFIREYLTVGKHKKRNQKISTLLKHMQEQIVDWDLIFEYINSEMTYEEFLNTEYWLIITQYLKKQSNFTCYDCGRKFTVTKQLNVHHLTYENHGREHLTEVQQSDLVVLCEDCHKNRHANDYMEDTLYDDFINWDEEDMEGDV